MNRSIALSILDAVLVAATLMGMVVVHEHNELGKEDQFLFMLPIPVVYLVLSSLLARSNLAVAAARAYLMYFCMAIVCAGLTLSGLLHDFDYLFELPSDKMVDELRSIFATLVSAIPQMILPFVCGVGLYTISSVFERETTGGASENASSIETRAIKELAQALGTLGQSQTTVAAISNTSGVLTALNEQLALLQKRIQSSAQSMSSMHSASTSVGNAFQQLKHESAELSQRLVAMQADTLMTKEQTLIVAKSVTEMRKIVEEFATLSSCEF